MTYVIAANRELYADSCQRLAARTGSAFIRLSSADQLTVERLHEIQPRKVFFPHWSSRIPAEIHNEFDCVIFHMTDLPFGRGGTPLQNLIARGFSETAMTALQCVEELDAGPVLLKRPLGLEGRAEDIYRRARDLIEDMIVDIIATDPQPQPQYGDPVHFQRRTPEQSDMSSLRELRAVYDHIRMLDAQGYPHAFLETPHLRIEFGEATLADNEIVCTAVVRVRKP